MGKDLTSLFASAFTKFAQGQGQRQPSTIIDMNDLASMKRAAPLTDDDDSIQKAYESSLHPEKQGAKEFEAKKAKEEFYKTILNSITAEEYNNLIYLIEKGGYITLTMELLKSIGKSGNSLDTERLEQWGCIKRDKIDQGKDALIQITIKSLGRKVASDINKILRSQ